MCSALDTDLGFPKRRDWAGTGDKKAGGDEGKRNQRSSGLQPAHRAVSGARDCPQPVDSPILRKSAQPLFFAATLSLAPLRGLCFNFFPSLETGEAGPFAVRISRGKVGVIPLFFVPSARLPVTP